MTDKPPPSLDMTDRLSDIKRDVSFIRGTLEKR